MANRRPARSKTSKHAKARGTPRPAAKKTPRRPSFARRSGLREGGGSDKGAAKRDRRLAEAERLLKHNKVGDAFRAAQAVLGENPTDWRALEFVAPLLLHMNHLEMGVGALEEAMVHTPDSAGIQQRLAAEFMLAALKTGLRLAHAIETGQKTIARHGPNAYLFSVLIQVLDDAGRRDEAVKTADEAIVLCPKSRVLHFNKSLVLLHMGKSEEAVEACSGGLLPLGSDSGKPEGKLRRQYRSLAAGYDDNKLHQSFSARMARFLLEIAGTAGGKRILDAGCGTGLLATHLKAARMVGIDQSPDMLAKARARGLHDELVEGDLVRAMAARMDRFDLVVSACALYHIADLAPFFREAARLLVPGGYVFFSVDAASDRMEIARTPFNPRSREYAHSRRYLRRLAAETGFAETEIRILPHRLYPGFWCAFEKKT